MIRAGAACRSKILIIGASNAVERTANAKFVLLGLDEYGVGANGELFPEASWFLTDLLFQP